MDSPFMSLFAKLMEERSVETIRFEFKYMAARREGGKKRPPPKAETLIPEFEAILDEVGHSALPLVIGGKSMGGRVASMVADALFAQGRICGLLCLGYPFHPPGRPEQLRTAHLADLRTPALIVQGTRDEFGTREEVASYRLSPQIAMLWLEDGDHDLKPRKRVSGFSAADHLGTMAATAFAWAERCCLRAAHLPRGRGP